MKERNVREERQSQGKTERREVAQDVATTHETESRARAVMVRLGSQFVLLSPEKLAALCATK